MICDGNSRTQKETGDCKPRLRGRYSSVRYQQDRLEEFPNRANWFRENWGAANVGGAVHRPISGRSTDSACQETGNRDATSHPQAAPVRQFLRKNSVNGWRFSTRFRASRSTRIAWARVRAKLYFAFGGLHRIDTCSLDAVDSQRPHDNITIAKKVHKFNRFDDFSPTHGTLRRRGGSENLTLLKAGGPQV